MNARLSTTQQTAVKALIAAGFDPTEALSLVASTPAAKEPKADGRNFEARAHNAEARIARLTAPENAASTKGLFKDERRLLAAILREELGREFTSQEWADNAAAYKAGEFTIEGFASAGVRA